MIRSIIFSVGTDKVLPAGMVSFAAAVSSGTNSPSKNTLDKDVVLMLRGRFINKVNEVISFIKKINNKSRSLYPLHVEVTPGYAAGYGAFDVQNEKGKVVKDTKDSVIKKVLADSYRKDTRLVDLTIASTMEAVQSADNLIKDLRVNLQERNAEVEVYKTKQEELLATIERLEADLKTRPKSKKRRNRDGGIIEGANSLETMPTTPGVNERKHMGGIERPVASNVSSKQKGEQKVRPSSQKKVELQTSLKAKTSVKHLSPLLAYMNSAPVLDPTIQNTTIQNITIQDTTITEQGVVAAGDNASPAIAPDELISTSAALQLQDPTSDQIMGASFNSSGHHDSFHRQEVLSILDNIVRVIDEVCSAPDGPDVQFAEEVIEGVNTEDMDIEGEDLYEQQGIYDDDDESLDSRDIEIDELTANLRSAMSQIMSLQDDVDSLHKTKDTLTNKTTDLSTRLYDMTHEAMTLSEAKEQLTQDLTALTAEHKIAKNKIAILRDAVQDGYKLHASENAKKEELRLKVEKEAEMLRLSKQVETCTQITCAVCAMRDEDVSIGTPLYLAPTSVARPGSVPKTVSRPTTSTGLKRSTSPVTVNQSTKVTIVSAKPRSINFDPSVCTDSVLSGSIELPMPHAMVPAPTTHHSLSRSLSAANTSNKRIERDHGAMRLAKKLSMQYINRPKTAQMLSRELYSNFKQINTTVDDASLATESLVQQFMEMEDYAPESRNKFSTIKNLPK